MFKKRTYRILLIALILIGTIVIPEKVSAQEERGWIEGIVAIEDEEGNLKAPPKVKGWSNFIGHAKVYQKGKNISMFNTIDMSGVFVINDLDSGTYNLMVELPEYKVANIREVEVKAGQPTVLEIVLSVKGAGWQESVVASSVFTLPTFNEQLKAIHGELTEIKEKLQELLQQE